jgi:hypothetical protein
MLISWKRMKWTRGWVPFLGESLGSQLFQVKLNLVHRYPAFLEASQCARHCIPTSTSLPFNQQQHTFTLLCANLSLLISVRKPVRVPTITVATPVPQHTAKNIGTHTPISQENQVSSLSSIMYLEFCFSEAI